MRAVDALSLNVEPGEHVVLLGPSGCGKTTTLRLVAGLESPDGGQVVLGNADATYWPPQQRDIALVFQDAALYPHLDVRANLAFGAQLRRMPAKEIAQRVDEFAERLGLTSLLGRRPEELSGGERRRVALGRALVRRPRVLLLDEPLSGLDGAARRDLQAELSRLHRDLPTTTLHVTHDQEEALTLADRLAVMRAGRLVQVGPPRELYDRPSNTFVAGFLGWPTMNFLNRQRDGVDCLLGVRPREITRTSEPADYSGRVETVQDLGHEQVVTLHGPESLCVVLPAREPVRHGDRVAVRFDAATLHWFDAQTGLRL